MTLITGRKLIGLFTGARYGGSISRVTIMFNGELVLSFNPKLGLDLINIDNIASEYKMTFAYVANVEIILAFKEIVILIYSVDPSGDTELKDNIDINDIIRIFGTKFNVATTYFNGESLYIDIDKHKKEKIKYISIDVENVFIELEDYILS